MEDFLNLHGINRSDMEHSSKDSKRDSTSRSNVNRRSAKKFVRSDALSPNSANKFLIEAELEKINRRNLLKSEKQEFRNNNNLENKMDLGNSSK